MGKTGTTTIQRSLASNVETLRQQDISYLGQWMGRVDPRFDGYAGFQKFLGQNPQQLADCGRAFLESIHGLTGTCLVSNEQFLENIPKLREFFGAIAHEHQLQILIYVRHPVSWLPSAYAQWGVAHKTNEGIVESFAVKARKLIGQYDYIRQWREAFGTAVVVREFRDGFDVVEDFASVLGVKLPELLPHRQERLPPSELVLRASFNSHLPGPVMPDEFNHVFPRPMSGFPVSISAKNEHLFNHGEIGAIIDENAELFKYIHREFGLWGGTLKPPAPRKEDNSELSDMLLGYLVDVVTAQAQQIREMRDRLTKLEGR